MRELFPYVGHSEIGSTPSQVTPPCRQGFINRRTYRHAGHFDGLTAVVRARQMVIEGAEGTPHPALDG
jgi:hypothetical protein